MASFSDTAFDTGAFSVTAFDFGSGPAPTPPAAPVIIPSGGIPSRGKKTRREISRDREKLGLLDDFAIAAQEAIREVAKRQAERLELDEQKRFDELYREVQLRGLEWESRYLEALNSIREHLINEEIAQRLRKINDEREMLEFLILVAASV